MLLTKTLNPAFTRSNLPLEPPRHEPEVKTVPPPQGHPAAALRTLGFPEFEASTQTLFRNHKSKPITLNPGFTWCTQPFELQLHEPEVSTVPLPHGHPAAALWMLGSP